MTKPINEMNAEELAAHERTLRTMLGVALGLDTVFVGLLAYMTYRGGWNLTVLIAGIPIMLANVQMIRSLKGMREIHARREALSVKR